MDSDLDDDNTEDDAGNNPERQVGCAVQSRAASVTRMRTEGRTSGKRFPSTGPYKHWIRDTMSEDNKTENSSSFF